MRMWHLTLYMHDEGVCIVSGIDLVGRYLL